MAEASEQQSLSAQQWGGGDLRSLSFLSLLVTQLLTAINDNIFRWLVIGIGKEQVEPEQVGFVLMAGTASFVLPYLILAAPAGFCADRFSKRTVIVVCKLAEVIIMVLGMAAILLNNLPLLFVAVALMGAQSAMMSPAKLGSIPEMLKPEKISAANGLIGMSTVIATVVGMAIGNVLCSPSITGGTVREKWWLSAAVLIGIAAAGWAVSFLIARLTAANPTRKFPYNAPLQSARDLRTLASNRPMLRVALGIVFFWSIGALAQLNIDQFAGEGRLQEQYEMIPLLISLVAGVGIGSVLAGVWSGGRVELGILPLGAGGVALSAMLLFTVQGALKDPASSMWTASFFWACILLFSLGTSAGLFSVPLEAYMQHRSPRESRGSILAASNLMTFSGILLMAILFAGMRTTAFTNEPLLSARQIFLLCGIFTIPVFIYIVCLIPQASIRFVVWLASCIIYRIRVQGRENLPAVGGALVVPNHISWLDGILLLLISSRPIRMIVFAGNFQNRWLRWMAELYGVILMTPRPKSIAAAIKTARQALREGELVCIFPEGGISRTGQIQAFRPGCMKILQGAEAPVIPVYFDGLWGSIFSFERGRFFWKWPKKIPYPIAIHIGAALEHVHDVYEVRRAVQDLGAKAVRSRMTQGNSLGQSFIRACKRAKRRIKAADSTGAELSGGALLTRSLVVRRLLRRHTLAADEQYVGLLLPPSLGGVVANMALALDQRIAVNLNYTVSSDVMNDCIRQARIKHVLTSRKFMEKMSFDLDAELVYLEDFKDLPTSADKLTSAIAAYAVPASVLVSSLGLNKIDANDTATVIFTSGSTGSPKGVMLTHANIASNVEAIDQVVHLAKDDVLLGVLPFFHSLGYTVTLWAVMSLDIQGVYHYSPLDSKQIGKLCEKHGVTILLSTPTFLRSYLRRCEKEQMKTVNVVVAGAEKLPTELCDAFEEKFGVRPVEGYGTTELSPLVSVNVPPSRSIDNFQEDCREGSVGRPVPGVTAKVLDLDSEEELTAGSAGMLWVAGPNVMKGYLDQPEKTSEVVKDGWYCTGDVAVIDDEGFIHITGRISRFSKIGGEMVPHIKVEETLNELLGAKQEEGPIAVVTAVPDSKKGERLIVIHRAMEKTPDELRQELSQAGLPNIFIPSSDSFLQIEEMPVLGTGKLDLKGVQKIAAEHFGEA